MTSLRSLLKIGLLSCLWITQILADPEPSTFSAAGYFRTIARPDFQGAASRLGLWNINGRLLNEGPWVALELKYDVIPFRPDDVWTSLHAKIEGPSVLGEDEDNGALSTYRLTQLYVQTGHLLIPNLTWQLGTLHTYFGDLGLYDMRPAEIFYNTVGLSAHYQASTWDLLLGFGDSGYAMHPHQYHTVLTVGGTFKWHPIRKFEIGLGGEYFYEPKVKGNRNAPHTTPLPPEITYEDFLRGEVVEHFLELYPSRVQDFPKPMPVSADSFKLIGYLGFGGLGPVLWNHLFVNFLKRHPERFYTESALNQSFDIFVKDWTDERFQINAGDEIQLKLIPQRLDALIGALMGYHYNLDNTIAPSEEDRFFWSVVARTQFYITPTLHLLTEGSYAYEHSLQGNLWRAHYDSIFQSQDGRSNSRGLEFGDLDTRRTWQLKAGFVFNPTGYGIFSRPSIRLLYGIQHSNMHNAFGNSFNESLDQYDEFVETQDRLWHSLIALEAEAWF